MTARPRIVVIGLILLAACICLADDTAQPSLIDAGDQAALSSHIGEYVSVQGIVSAATWSASGAVMNIDFARTQQSRFLAVIFQKNRAKLDEAFAGDVGKAITGAKIRIRGKLEEYGGQQQSFKGRPQLIITLADQITILELPGAKN